MFVDCQTLKWLNNYTYRQFGSEYTPYPCLTTKQFFQRIIKPTHRHERNLRILFLR